MNRNRSSLAPVRKFRKGLSVPEALVVLILLVILLSLLGPGIRSRPAGWNLECKNNLSNIGRAIAHFEANHGHMPDFVDQASRSWTYQLLPYLDAGVIYDRLEAGELDPAEVYLKILACPLDDTALKVKGQTSYVVNVGYIDSKLWADEDLSHLDTTHSPENVTVYAWAGTGEKPRSSEISIATGAFHRHMPEFLMTSASISGADGNQFTILASENVQAQRWYGDLVADNGFGASVELTRFAQATTLKAPLALNKQSLAAFEDRALPNRGITTANEGAAPRPSSHHTGTVNVLYADGRVQTMFESIEPSVYYRLLTSDGTRFGQETINEEDF